MSVARMCARESSRVCLAVRGPPRVHGRTWVRAAPTHARESSGAQAYSAFGWPRCPGGARLCFRLNLALLGEMLGMALSPVSRTGVPTVGVAAEAGAWVGRPPAGEWSHREEGGLPEPAVPAPAELWHSGLGSALRFTRPLSLKTLTATQKGFLFDFKKS